MRVNIVNQAPDSGGGFNIAGATMTGPLLLAADPVASLEAATKKYVDNAVNSLTANHITTGILPVGRLPAFTGDFSSVVGTNTLTLNNTAVTPGTYTKVTVDAKGRVTAGTSLSLTDIPALDYSKIVNNKPTTMDGFGITDGVKTTTDSMTGPLTAHAAPTSANHAATKGYVDGLVSSSSTLSVGDTVRRTTTTTPSGFLRCNGALLSKSTYSALYAVIGDTYNETLIAGAGIPWNQQYQINTTQSAADLGAWSTGTPLQAATYETQIVVTTNRVYILGGYAGGGGANTVYTASINADGTLGAWSTAAFTLPLPQRQGKFVAGNNNYLYFFVGLNANSPSTAVYKAPINADGTLGSWTSCVSLPVAVYSCNVMVVGNYIYLMGGLYNSSSLNTVYSAVINADGSLSAWTQMANLAYGVCASVMMVTSGRVYLIGGNENNAPSARMQTAVINADGTLGAWGVASGTLPAVASYAQGYVTKNRAYFMGGYTANSSASSAVYSAPVNADGTLGSWATCTSLPATVTEASAFATNTTLYLTAAAVNGAMSNVVYYVKIAGGLNDYSGYYNGTITPTDTTKFALPNTTSSDPINIYTYIKY